MNENFKNLDQRKILGNLPQLTTEELYQKTLEKLPRLTMEALYQTIGILDQEMINYSYKILEQINKELQTSNILNLNYLLLRVSTVLSKDISIPKEEILSVAIDETNKMLWYYSKTFKDIYIKKDFLSMELYLFINEYMNVVLRYYNNLMITNQSNFDRYVEISNGKTPKKSEAKNLYMEVEDIQNTMQLLNEAVRNYYEIYHNKTLFVTFSDEQIIQFKIKESELAHLLGVNLRNIINNEKYVDLFKITKTEIDGFLDPTYDPNGMAAISILHKIIDISDGNLLQFEEDRLKRENFEEDRLVKAKGHKYKIMGGDDNTVLSRYSKINMRSKAFIDFKPLEEITLALNFPKGYEIIRRSQREDSQHSSLISKNNLSNVYKYSTLITNYDKNSDRRYFETLFLRTPKEFEQLPEGTTGSIATSVELASDNGSGSIRNNFSKNEQDIFLEEIQNDFKKLNLRETVEYFRNLREEYSNERGL